LFGHIKGAFTGAVRNNPGRLGNGELTDILLDEVGDSTVHIQAKLLQVVESRMYTPVGGTQGHTRNTDARLIFSTHRDLPALVRDGRFREDLYWRLQGLVVHIPPLRECPDTIPDLVRSLVFSCKKDQGKEDAGFPLSKQDLIWCQRYHWPGNLRELRLLIWQFVYEDGRRSLREIHLSRRVPFPGSMTFERPGETSESLVFRAVKIVLDETLRGHRPSLGTVGSLTRHFDRMVRKALYRFKGERRLNAQELERLFTKEKARDVHTKIGRFRYEVDSPGKTPS
jgi:transcriptional regulator with GAF, ATPase, and Fis domain